MRSGFEESLFITTVHREKFVILGFFFKLGFIPCKAEQPLQGMGSQEKETQKDLNIQGISLKGTYSSWVSVNSRLKAT